MEMLLCFYTLCLAVHTYIDFKQQILPDAINLALAFSGLMYAYYFADLLSALQGMSLAAVVMLTIFLVSRGGMGLGDVKLACALGLWLGVEQTFLCLLLAFISGGLIGITLLMSGRKTRKDAIPFGPYLCMSGWLSLFWGQEIIYWYWNLY